LANTAAAGNAHLVALFDCYHFLLDAWTAENHLEQDCQMVYLPAYPKSQFW
jgi:hypothetical protein